MKKASLPDRRERGRVAGAAAPRNKEGASSWRCRRVNRPITMNKVLSRTLCGDADLTKVYTLVKN